MRGDEASAPERDERRQRDSSVGRDDRLRRLDHHLEFQRAGRLLPPVFERLAPLRKRAHLLRRGDLRQRDDEVRRQRAARPLEQPREEQIHRPQGAALQLLAERLDANADRRGQRAIAHRRRHFVRGDLRVPIFFVIRAVPEAVLEIDPIVLDRFARQLVDDAEVDAIGERGVEADGGGEGPRVGRMILQRLQRERAELLRRVGLEQMRAAVDDVHRLAARRIAGELARDGGVRLVDRIEDRRQRVVGDRRVRHAAEYNGLRGAAGRDPILDQILDHILDRIQDRIQDRILDQIQDQIQDRVAPASPRDSGLGRRAAGASRRPTPLSSATSPRTRCWPSNHLCVLRDPPGLPGLPDPPDPPGLHSIRRRSEISRRTPLRATPTLIGMNSAASVWKSIRYHAVMRR